MTMKDSAVVKLLTEPHNSVKELGNKITEEVLKLNDSNNDNAWPGSVIEV